MAVLMLANHLPRFIGQQRREVWDRRFASVLAGRRATVVGLGALGGSAARRLRGFDVRVTDVLERVVSGRTKARELERLLPWTWKAERPTAAARA